MKEINGNSVADNEPFKLVPLSKKIMALPIG